MSLARNLAKLAHGVSSGGILGVPYGGTTAATLSGLIKGNGAAALTSAIDGTDYVSPTKLASGTLPASFTTLAVSGNTTLGDAVGDTLIVLGSRLIADTANGTFTSRFGIRDVNPGGTNFTVFPNAASGIATLCLN